MMAAAPAGRSSASAFYSSAVIKYLPVRATDLPNGIVCLQRPHQQTHHVTQQCYTSYNHRQRRCLHSSIIIESPVNRLDSLPYNSKDLFCVRQYSSSNTLYINDNDDQIVRRTALKYGRARRKRQLKQREEAAVDSDEIEHATSESTDDDRPTNKKENEGTETDNDNNKSTENVNGEQQLRYTAERPMFFPRLDPNPLRERYILKYRKRNYPKSIAEWEDIFVRTKDKYLWTFEGFLLKDKVRDEYGNVIETDDDSDDEEEDEEESIKEKATDAANQASSNLQKNILTIKEEAPKLLKHAQEATGISTRGELREWVGEQLKLGTKCLSEFMKGYRKSRDDEVDRMLHEYFQDLDKKEEDEVEDDSSVDEPVEEEDAKPEKMEKRLWGRRERRRMKKILQVSSAETVEANEK